MYCNVYILLIFCLLRVYTVPSGLQILSGRDAIDNEYPFIVRLERQILLIFAGKIEAEDNVHICTCVTLTPIWTLTAGHCIDRAGPVKELTANLKIKSVIRYGAPNRESIADVTSSLHHPSFKDHVLDMQNDIGLLRTNVIKLSQYARISALDINTLGGHMATLAGYGSLNYSSLANTRELVILKKGLRVLNVVIVRFNNKDVSTFPAVCAARRCVPSRTSICPADTGGPMLHSTGVIGINSISMENLKLCSFKNNKSLIDIGIITPTSPYNEWITNHIKRDFMLYKTLS